MVKIVKTDKGTVVGLTFPDKKQEQKTQPKEPTRKK